MRPGAAAAPVGACAVRLEPVARARSAQATAAGPGEPALARALGLLADCQARYRAVRDYTCTFSKRERIKGRLTPLHVLTMKVRTRPQSIYIKFQRPRAGREAIYVVGRDGGKVLAHDVGLNKLLAGTLRLEPTGNRAMEDCRHPITEAGIGPLLNNLQRSWSRALDPTESIVFREDQPVGPHRCTLIETTHPRRLPDLSFYKVRVFIDGQLGLPIRFEAYDWPQTDPAAAELVEEYTYADLTLNVGLRDLDFDVSNAGYAFGRF